MMSERQDIITNDEMAKEIARMLLQIRAVSLSPNEPFTWSSGWKSPIYCDNRLTMSYPEVRSKIADSFAEIIRSQYPDVEVIGGISTGGIPHAAWVAERLNLPMIYIRDKAKGHGKQSQIEGVLQQGQKTVVIEDLISTGGSSLRAALAVRNAGGDVMSVISIFTYEFEQAAQSFADVGIPVQSLSRYSILIQEALEQNLITNDDVNKLKQWRVDPANYGQS